MTDDNDFHAYTNALNELRDQHAKEIIHLHNLKQGIPDQPDDATRDKVDRLFNKHKEAYRLSRLTKAKPAGR